MTVENLVDLTVTFACSCKFFVCLFDLTDFYDLTAFSTFFEFV